MIYLVLSEYDDTKILMRQVMQSSPYYKPIHNYLTQIGFTDIEVLLYLKLLSLGPSSISDLHKKTSIPRTTVHENIEKLIQKGIVTQTSENARRKIIAEPPIRLQTLLMNQQVDFQKKADEISMLSQNLGDLVNSISALIPSTMPAESFVVKYFQGVEGFLDVHQRTLDSKKDLLFVSNMDAWKKIFTDDFAYKFYVPERVKRKIFARTLALDSKLAREIQKEDKKYYREMRFLPEGIKFDPTLIISDSEISIMTIGQPYTAIIIYNDAVAQMFRSFFEMLWMQAKKGKD